LRVEHCTKTILITGGSGLLAPYLAKISSQYGTVFVTSRSKGPLKCDLTDSNMTRKLLLEVRPNWVIHAAAMTDVDACERNPVQARQANGEAVKNIVDHMDEDTHFAYISTDQVYSDNTGPHLEGSEAPVNVYGSTKLEGEYSAQQHNHSLIFRTNLFGRSMTAGRVSLDDFVINGLRHGKAITVFDDVQFSPLHMRTLAQNICDALAKGLCGTFNLGSRDGMSKADFAFAIADHFKLDTKMVTIGQSSALSNRAQRPHDLRLEVTKYELAMGRIMPTLMQEIQRL